MKFPRNARIFRGQLDAAPLASVFFLLVMFLMLASLVYTPGVALRLPVADDLPGRDQPMVAVAIDSSGRLYYENQSIHEGELHARLIQAVKASPVPLSLLIQADKAVTTEMLVRLSMLARSAGITNGSLATLPRPIGPTP
ncbi:MAG TPA: biopolymer transporter ExbD [Verrucomicrobiae bacterium]|nr:biopolymer transporter ExbD [Verrucomicrobiae bacterium]